MPGLGTFAALTSPTVTGDGTVVLGTSEGVVLGLHPDGSAYWNRHLSGKTIVTSPAVGSDGSVYVVGVPHRDHRAGARPSLYRFTPGGGAPANTTSDFPIYGGQLPKPGWIGAPNVWRFGSDEAIFVPALYSTFGGFDVHLMAFSPDGGIMADWTMYCAYGAVTEAESWTKLAESLTGAGFEHGQLPLLANPSIPGVTVSDTPQGGTPSVVLIDRWNRATIVFTFCVGASCSPAPGFTERVRRSHAPRDLWSSAMVRSDNQAIVGTDDGVVFGGPSAIHLNPIRGLKGIYATPTVAADGRVVVVNLYGEVMGLRDGAVISRIPLSGGTMARPAASRTHIFVATTDGLHTLDSAGTNSVLTFPWVGGGIWPPAVGPQGHVYAIASNVLFVFPPPRPSRPVVQPRREP